MKKISLLAALFTLVLAGCKKNSEGLSHQGVSNKELKIGISQEFENFNPIIAQMLATTYLYKIVGRSLLIIDADGNWAPQAADQVPSLENGQARFIEHEGKKTIAADWRIRDDQFWGDGKPVTAHDVEFSWNVGRHPNISVGEKDLYNRIVEIQIDENDPKKFTAIYNKARWDFHQLASFYILPKHIEEPVFQKHKDEKLGYEKNTNYTTNPTLPGLYNGPYRVSEVKLGSHVTFVPNEKWKGKKPTIQKIVAKIIPDTSTMEANLRSGTIDMVSILGMTFDQALSFDKKVKKESLPFDVNFKSSLIYEHIDLQLSNPILRDKKVRKALVHAVNRQDLVKALFDGKQQVAIHNLATIDPWYTDSADEIVLYSYSPRKAKKLLEEAGWALNKDGYRYKAGERLSLQLMTTSGDKIRGLVQGYLQDQWKKVGIEITIKNEPARVYFGETVRKSKYPAMAMFAWMSSPENSPKSMFHSESIPSEKNGYSGQNSMRWVNKKVDQFLDALESEFSSEKRKKLISKALYHYTDDVPVIPLYYRSDISITPKGLKGYRIPGHLYGPTNQVEDWHF